MLSTLSTFSILLNGFWNGESIVYWNRSIKINNINLSQSLSNSSTSPHTFHVPVMGTGFTIDTPMRIGRFGISSVLSIGDDMLIEQMRRLYSRKFNKTFEPISQHEPDARARRICAYLNLAALILQEQVEQMKASSFEPDNDLTKHFELLPDGELKSEYQKMLNCTDESEKKVIETSIKEKIVPGSIDVNIMTKIDWNILLNDDDPKNGVAQSALRGFATSLLTSGVVLSAGMNRKLFTYMSEFEDFYPDSNGLSKKTIILKVSDYRSALLQGKLLARLGLWVSEFRVESGLNCGGHAFASAGELMGPILEEFNKNRSLLSNLLGEIYLKGLAKKNISNSNIPEIKITVQGGVGTSREHNFLLKNYQVDSVGWGTPFLLVPEVTNVDEHQLNKLCSAGQNDVFLSDGSPLGVPFWKLKTSASEDNRLNRIERGKAGSPCPKGYLASDSEFTEVPICRASRKYQKLKVAQINETNYPDDYKKELISGVHQKTCLCLDLTGGVINRYKIEKPVNTAVCCGPGIVYFDKVVSFKEMVDHIYGKASILSCTDRAHMFINELTLYYDHLKDNFDKTTSGLISRSEKYLNDFKSNLLNGIEYYRDLADQFEINEKESFLTALNKFQEKLEQFTIVIPVTA